VLVLNKALAADERVEICQLPVGDGVTLCRRVKWAWPGPAATAPTAAAARLQS